MRKPRPAASTLTGTSLDTAISIQAPWARGAELVDMRSTPGWVLRKLAAYKFGDLIFYQNDREGCRDDRRQGRKRE
jgi:hypothetical protein